MERAGRANALRKAYGAKKNEVEKRTSIELAAIGLEGSAVVHRNGVALLRLARALHLVGDVNLELVGSDEAGKSGGEEKSGLHGVCCVFGGVGFVGCGEEGKASLSVAWLGFGFGRGVEKWPHLTKTHCQIGDDDYCGLELGQACVCGKQEPLTLTAAQ